MQNKPNLPNTQMNISSVKTRNYENKIAFCLAKSKPKTNPIKPNFIRLWRGGFKCNLVKMGNHEGKMFFTHLLNSKLQTVNSK
jgi:hypothetical protein